MFSRFIGYLNGKTFFKIGFSIKKAISGFFAQNLSFLDQAQVAHFNEKFMDNIVFTIKMWIHLISHLETSCIDSTKRHKYGNACPI
jgi:hypothetical protein